MEEFSAKVARFRQTISKQAMLRLFIITGLTFLILGQLGILLDWPHRSALVFGLYGFVFHVVFGKGYALLPAHFDRQLTWSTAPAIHYFLATLGVIGLGLDPFNLPSIDFALIGSVSWFLGVIIFVVTIGTTIRGNVLGSETGTGEFNSHRYAVDRSANAAMPVALVYLVVGSYETAAMSSPLPTIIVSFPHQVSHLLAVGTATLLLFAIGSRILPRFFVAYPPLWLVRALLLFAIVGPIGLVIGMNAWVPLEYGAVFQTLAFLCYGLLVAQLVRKTDRRRVGFIGIAMGAAAGLGAILLGLFIATDTMIAVALQLHYRFTIVGFLTLSILGVALQFYPPGAGTYPGVSDRTAAIALLAIGTGLLAEAIGIGLEHSLLHTAGTIIIVCGAVTFWYLFSALIVERGLR